MERRLPAALAACLVLLGALAAPAAAAPPVTFDQASGSAQAGVNQLEADQDSGTGPSITVSASLGDGSADASASMQASFVEGEDGFTIVYRTSVSATATPDAIGAVGQAGLNGTILTHARVPYRITVTASGNGLFSHGASFQGSQFEEGETGVKTGMLDPNETVQVSGSAQCGTGFMVNLTCSGEAEVRIEIGEPTPPVVIGSGPSGVVGQRDATFQFTTLDATPPPGRFECSLDAGSFTPCASPLELTQLAEGEHVLRVRYHPDGQDPSEPAERRWTVDTTPPVVSFGALPAGADTTVTFSANEPASFHCSADGGAVFACSSPHALHGLAVGLHDFTVEATDAAGNVSDQIRTEWEVVAPPPPPSLSCPGGAQPQVAFGPVVARGCFAPEAVGTRQALVARGPVSVNGVRLAPHAGSRIVVDPALAGGSVRAIGPVTISPGDLQLGWVLEDGFNFDALAQGGAAVANRSLALQEGILNLAEMPISGALQFELSPDNGGQAKVTARVTLPRATFTALPGLSPEGQGLTVEVPITVSHDQGVTGGVRLKLAQAHLFRRLKVKDLDLFYDHTIRTFEGSAGLKLSNSPPGLAEPTLTVGVTIGPDGLIGPLRRLFFQASALNRPVGYGIFVQRFGAALERTSDPAGHPLARFSGNAGLSLGPRVAIGSFEIEALSLDGTVTLDVPLGPQPPEPFSLAVAGSLKVVDVPLVNARVRYVPPTRVEIAGNVDYTLFGYGIAGELASDAQGRPLSWVSPDGFNLEVRAQAGFPGLGRTDPAEAVLSTTGWAACIGPEGDKVGFGRRWNDPEMEAMSDSCDVGPYRETATAAQAGSPGVTIRRGTRLAVLSARGDGAPPKIVVTGPGGARFETPAGPEGVRDGGNLLVQDPRTSTTHVVLRDPAPGRWSVSGSVTRLDVAEGLPPVRIRAKVRGKGARRTLSWNAGPLPFGQRLTFVERADRSANVLRSTTRRRGRLTFTPDPGLARARRIEVVVTRNGMPRLDRVVARFTAPKTRLGKVKRLRVRGRVLTWRHRPGLRYEVAIATRDGAVTARSVGRARVRLPRRGRMRVTIVAVDGQGRVGPRTSSALHIRR